MGGIGYQLTRRIEEGAGEIEPLADVHRAGALLQPPAHLLGDGSKAVVVELKQGGIGPLLHNFNSLINSLIKSLANPAACRRAGPLQQQGSIG